MLEGNDLFKDLRDVIVKPDYQKALLLIEKLTHNYHYWRNNPQVIEWAGVIYYKCDQLLYAKDWAMMYLCARSQKKIPWTSWFDNYYLWRYMDVISFITKIAEICGSPPDDDIQEKFSDIYCAFENSLKSKDFLISSILDFNEQMAALQRQIFKPFTNKLQGINLHEIYNVIEIVRSLENFVIDDDFAEYIISKAILLAAKNFNNLLNSNTLKELKQKYLEVLRVLESGFCRPIPEKITYGRYWKRTQIAILSEYVRSLVH